MKFSLPGLDFFRRKKRRDDDEFDEDFEDEDDEDDVKPGNGSGSTTNDNDDYEDEDDDDVDGVVSSPPSRAVARRDEEDEDEEEEDEYFSDDEDGEGRKKALSGILAPLLRLQKKTGAALRPLIGKGRRRMIVLGGTGIVVLILAGGVGAFFFMGGEEEPAALPPAPLDAGTVQEAAVTPEPFIAEDENGDNGENGQPDAPEQGQGGAQTQAPPPDQQQPRSLNEIAAQATANTSAGITVPSVPTGAFARIPQQPEGAVALAEAPDPTLQEQGPGGMLPKVDPSGRTPLQVYARPFGDAGGRPRIAIVVAGLGLNDSMTEAAIRRLPPDVTLAFDPYGVNLDTWVSLARRSGHETLLGLPMASEAFPVQDPGPLALQVAINPEENLARMRSIMSRTGGYVGMLSSMGSAIKGRDDMISPVLDELKRRGLMFVDGGGTVNSLAPAIATQISLPRAMVDMTIDDPPSRAGLDGALARLERVARENGGAVGLASAYPLTLERLNAWIPSLEAKGLALAPVSALADRQTAKAAQ